MSLLVLLLFHFVGFDKVKISDDDPKEILGSILNQRLSIDHGHIVLESDVKFAGDKKVKSRHEYYFAKQRIRFQYENATKHLIEGSQCFGKNHVTFVQSKIDPKSRQIILLTGTKANLHKGQATPNPKLIGVFPSDIYRSTRRYADTYFRPKDGVVKLDKMLTKIGDCSCQKLSLTNAKGHIISIWFDPSKKNVVVKSRIDIPEKSYFAESESVVKKAKGLDIWFPEKTEYREVKNSETIRTESLTVHFDFSKKNPQRKI